MERSLGFQTGSFEGYGCPVVANVPQLVARQGQCSYRPSLHREEVGGCKIYYSFALTIGSMKLQVSADTCRWCGQLKPWGRKHRSDGLQEEVRLAIAYVYFHGIWTHVEP